MDHIAFLSQDHIQQTLQEYATESDIIALRTILQKRFASAECIVLSQQIMLRQKATNKFPYAARMLFDSDGLAYATHAAVAAYHGQCFSSDDVVLDICTGIGSDLLEISKQVHAVHSLDANAKRIRLARYNVTSCGNPKRATFHHCRFEDFTIPKEVTAVFADPLRRNARARYIDPAEYSPAIDTIFFALEQNNIKNGKCLIKLSPACDYTTLLGLGRIEVISVDGEVKEVLFINDRESLYKRTAVLLHTKHAPFRIVQSTDTIKNVSKAKAYIIEPDAAIIRSGLVAEYAESIQATFLDPYIAYLTTDHIPSAPGGTAYQIHESIPYSVQKIKSYLKKHSITALAIKKRGFAETPKALQKKIGIKKGSNTFFLFIYRTHDRHQAVFAERCF